MERVRQIRELQERAARAVPAAVEQLRDGDWLRHSDSATTWWAGAALMHGVAPAADLAQRITVVEDFYASHGAPARFQVCPACPDGLDGALSARGYRRGVAVSLQVAAATHVARHLPTARLPVQLQELPDGSWLSLLAACQEPEADPAPERQLLQRVDLPSAYATGFLSGRPVAVGRAVADTGWTGVFAMATLPDARRQGAADAVLAALAGWAARRGSSHLYLQVTLDTAAALALYRRAGFEQLCTYHYRVARHGR